MVVGSALADGSRGIVVVIVMDGALISLLIYCGGWLATSGLLPV